MIRQTIMLSATLPDSIQRLASFYLNKNYIFLAVGIISGASKDIKQKFQQVNRYNKRHILTSILKEGLLFITVIKCLKNYDLLLLTTQGLVNSNSSLLLLLHFLFYFPI